MKSASEILLTGVTGLVGRYLLRDLLRTGHRVSVLVRGSQEATARERIAGLLDLWASALGRRLPTPVVLDGDLAAPGLGLGTAERRWLLGHCQAVIHSAANVSYQETNGEPWETNVNGTRRLLELCQDLGIAELHHLSTAFLCGDRHGLVREDELDCGSGPNNAYEKSKLEAERLVRGNSHVCATIYRPSIIVGDSRTGYTSTYHHFYRFLELAVRLAHPAAGAGSTRRRLPVRLPLTGDEMQNLVPVDWVSAAIVRLVQSPQWHGHTFHLVAREPLRLRALHAFVEDLLHLEGVEWVGPDGLSDPTSLEQRVLEQFRDYWAYLRASLIFDCRNTRAALPDLPPPPLDRDLTARLLAHARADNWGRGSARVALVAGPAAPAPLDCGHYLEKVLPQQVRGSALARTVALDLTFAFDIGGRGGGQWSCCWQRGELEAVRPGLAADAVVTYRTDASTFAALVGGRQSPQTAFFEGRIDILGDTEKGLKLATLFEQFLAEIPLVASRSHHAPRDADRHAEGDDYCSHHAPRDADRHAEGDDYEKENSPPTAQGDAVCRCPRLKH